MILDSNSRTSFGFPSLSGRRLGPHWLVPLCRVMAALVAVFGCTEASSAVAPGSEPKAWPANPAKHVVVLTRTPADAASQRLIKAAEAAAPPKDAVRKAAGETKLPETGPLWWYREELGVRIPFAVTGDAVKYFAELVGRYGKESFTRFVEPNSRLEYSAKVTTHKMFSRDDESFSNVRVVTLTLHFSQNFCATGTEGQSFQKERIVVFDSAGTLLKIFGDGTTESPVLAI